MGGPPQQIPMRFPCWCRAVYSWGGESKRDLGFVEGDLIECLNAGDGSWWTGRLRRDRREVGLFPSNFVEVLDQSFQPAPVSRSVSPMPAPNAAPLKSSGTFRKPFQSAREGTPEKEKTKSKWTPYSSMKTAQAPMSTLKKTGSIHPPPKENAFRVPSPPARAMARLHSRGNSPAPQSQSTPLAPQDAWRATSPAPSTMYRAASPNPPMRAVSPAIPRAVSPAPNHYRPHSPNPQMYRPGSAMSNQGQRPASPMMYQHDSRAPSPQPFKQLDYYQDHYDPAFDVGSSPPPPAPPPHRVNYQQERAPSPVHHEQYDEQDAHSPAPDHSPGMTPSPLRDAMNDVMSSLHDMSMVPRAPSPQPSMPASVWSPEAFGELQRTSNPPRSHSSLGNFRSAYHTSRETDMHSSPPSSRDGPPALGNYVQRMEQRLKHSKSDYSGSMDDTMSVSSHPPLQQATGLGSRIQRPESRGTLDRSDSQRQRMMLQRKSAYELGGGNLGRTMTFKSSVTSSSSGWRSNATTFSTSTQATSQSIMSKSSAGAVSATSAGSFSRRKFGMGSLRGRRPLSALSSRSQTDLHEDMSPVRPASPISGPSYHSSHATQPGIPTPVADWTTNPMESAGMLGGLGVPRAKKSGFFKKMVSTAKATARTAAADVRSTIEHGGSSRPTSRAGQMVRKAIPDGVTAISYEDHNLMTSSAHRDMGLGGGDWMQVRRDVNRSNSLSRNERQERAERCQMLDVVVMNPVDELYDQTEGDESLDGLPVSDPTDFQQPGLALVDKSTRFIASLPSGCSASTLATTYLCRPFRSDVQRLRAIFTWVSERITWEDDFVGDIDPRRVIQTKRGCSEEIATLVCELCAAVGLHAEVVRGFLKTPGEAVDTDALAHPNHWWNMVLCDGEWRAMDCSLASPTNPRRGQFSSANGNVADSWWFLARPMHICYTHVPCRPEHEHLCPPVAPELLLALPCACPPYFKHGVEVVDFETSMLHLEGLEMTHIKLAVPEDVECVAEVEARAFARDLDGDLFESGDTVRKPAFAQPHWIGGQKVFVVKAVLPGDEGTGVLKVYAGKRGLMHSINSNPHSLALALHMTHTGANPAFNFHTRHPTPHAQRHDLYVVQPQCHRLMLNNTFVFHVRQHPSSLARRSPPDTRSMAPSRPVSPNPFARPSSAMSMVSASASAAGSAYSTASSSASAADGGVPKPAKLAVQSPGGKIVRFTRRAGTGEEGPGGAWETVIKVGERGTWRGLVLADRSARWCVFAEWECI